MNKVSRPLFFTLLIVLMLAIVAAVIVNGPFSLGASGHGATLMFFDEDFSDSAFGWMIAIPILVLVGITLLAVFAGAALVAMLAVAFAAVMVVLAMLLAMTPFAIFLALPILAVYGLVKLFQCDRQRMVRAV